MARNLRGELEDWQGYAPSWRPDEGDVLVGVVQEFTVGSTSWGDVNVCTLLDEETDEQIAVWLSSTVLLSEFTKLDVKPGDRVGIRYDGKHPEKRYHRYVVRVDRDDPELRPRGGEIQAEAAPAAVPDTLPGLDKPKAAKKAVVTAVPDDDEEIPF